MSEKQQQQVKDSKEMSFPEAGIYSDADGWRMAYTPTEAPVYGGGTIVASFSDHSLLPEEAEAYFIFQGSSQRHICVGQRINPPTLEAVIPEHDKSEVVQLSICLCQNGEPSKTIATSDFLYLYDSAYYMAQFLMESVYNPNALESLEGIKSEHFDLTNEVLSTLDDRLTKAFEHLHVPDTWNLLGFPDEEPRPRETLLHFSARLGLKQFTTFLLDKPGSEDALQLPNRQNKLPRDLAQESDMEGFADLFTDYNKHDIVQWDTGRVQTQSTLFRRHEHGGATVSRNVRESMKSVDEDISLLRDFSQLMHGTVATVRHREPKPWKPDAPGIQEEGDIDDDFLQRRHYSDSQYMSSACGSSGGYPGSTVQHYSTGSTGEHMVPGASTHQRFPSVGDPPGYSPRQKILEANLRRLQDIHEGIQLLKQFNQGQMTGHEQKTAL
ncbi:rho guanine nucleotide exchange factor 28-like [Lingula anatina]|uniref:Rho guanine nucleotide exchange factor 28-like n=1 Tax=Lingula anatina TaxID=7574 RepID=A0A1S3J954_LINAN|nr:rho guanine nucleotide exchange factor 28-like [Lingula anatina]|eukprot:XP_013406399.1 rho guanine nucleotide exchange factor 28-like [Lingula anatina]